MWLVIFGLVCFWSGAAAIVAHLCGWPVLPVLLVVGLFTSIILTLAGSLCAATAVEFPDDRGINIQSYFGGTFKIKNSIGGERSSN